MTALLVIEDTFLKNGYNGGGNGDEFKSHLTFEISEIEGAYVKEPANFDFSAGSASDLLC